MLQTAVQGAQHTSQVITWTKEDGSAQDLIGSTVTGVIQPVSSGDERAIDGNLTPLEPFTAGQFTWSYGAADVGTPGVYLVQFTATYSDGKEISFADYWIVEPTLPWLPNSLPAMRKKLMEKIPARNGAPTYQQYTDAVLEAIVDFGYRLPLSKQTSLSIVAGVAVYDLPADFRKLIKLESPFSPSGVLNTPAGLIPVGSGYSERYTIAGNRITFIPTPQYTLDRTLWYTAGYVADENDTYQDLTTDDIHLVLLKAQALLLQLQANKAAGGGWRYRDGDVEVDKRDQGKSYQTQIKALTDEYLAAIKIRIGPVGMRS